jgi:hypothetical protein
MLLLLSCNYNNYNNLNNFVTLTSIRLSLPEDDADSIKHVGVIAIYKILFIHICCAFVGLGNKKNVLIFKLPLGF